MSRIITTHLTIPAPVHDVWNVLTDLDAYPDWNPFIRSAGGNVNVGERLHLTIQLPGGRPSALDPWVTAMEPGRYIECLGRLTVPGILDARHSFTTTALVGGRTLLQQSGTFTGVLLPLTGTLLPRTEAGFTVMNLALARHLARQASQRHEPPTS